jgi:hypothetical protein
MTKPFDLEAFKTQLAALDDDTFRALYWLEERAPAEEHAADHVKAQQMARSLSHVGSG